MFIRLISVLFTLVLLGATTTYVPAQETASALDPDAMGALEKMGKWLSSQQSLQFVVQDSIDKVDEDGRLLTYHHTRKIDVKRPDRFRVTVSGDLENEKIVYNGKLIVMDKGEVYAEAEAPATTDLTLEVLRGKYGVRRPLMELFYSNIGERAKGLVKEAVYVGETTVNGKLCDHVAFSAREGVEWQLWISKGKEPVPVKLMIHYEEFPGEPRYTANFVEVKGGVELPEGEFTFEPKTGAEKVAFEVNNVVQGETK